MEKINKRLSISADLSKYDYLAKEHSFIEVTEWTSGDGYDIHISCTSDRVFNLTHGELKAINKLVKKLKKFEDD
jgi:hypothetical protein